MAAYADRNAVLARAGAVRGAFTEASSVDYSAIDGFLEEVAGVINGFLAARSVSLPLSEVGSGTLVGVNADGALILALEGAYPGRTTDLPESVAALLAGARARYNAAMSAIASGTHAVIVYVDSLATDAGATSFWQKEPDYSPWTDWYAEGMGPNARKTDRF